ncbi:MAG TPA: ChaN family lipoprotein, partial [Paracoccaceae bacterium]|nr:ChaN family lipoprotein [Paracoccaceae bacterium]
WADSGWPDFAMYYPIFAAAPDAVIYGAGLPRSAVQDALQTPLSQHPLASRYGLDVPPSEAEQETREAMQDAAHCGALPAEMLPVMVDAQRLRDMMLAHVTLTALSDTGGPVAVITGNGHARADWGVPALLAHAAPRTVVFTLLQAEPEGTVPGGGDLTLASPAPERGDPCAVFAD